ncbi:GDNF family receptor alpha-like [Python bivittatus]|uniref:GDNF family receptor alpha-like n=1 Tax=Python bivittatus TaxID=176946 RepID=A0A9F5IRW5_PYTBI|nr:GDNF family receptor alpha-like [Python bivittatus]
MNSILFITVLVLYSMNESTYQAQTSKCQQLKERCVAARNGCESVWNLLEEVCYIPGNSCAVKDSSNCNKIIQFLVDQFPEFKDCICVKDNCSIRMLLGKKCSTDKGNLEPSPSIDTQFTPPRQIKTPRMVLSGQLGNDCSVAKDLCQRDNTCFTKYKIFQRVCRAEVAKCSLQMVVEQCFAAWKLLKKTVMGNCTCPEPVHKRCFKIWKNIFNNTCLQSTQEYQDSAIGKETYTVEETQSRSADHMKAKSQWKLSALSNYEYKQPQSCFQANMECVNDEVCNKQLSLYLQVCQINGSSCDINQCRAALHSFYTNMPFQVAQMLTFCDCMPSDDNCHQAKQFLHGHPCAIKMVPTPTCVHVMSSCQENKLCRRKYEAFTSKCLKHISQACLEENTCLETLNAIDPICSESTECRAAYVDLWGSLLRVKCTCEAAPPAEQSVCRWFHHILHGKVCLRQISGGNIDLYSSQIELPGKILPVTGKRSSFYDNTIITILYTSCIILILGIILLALLKTRACTTAYLPKMREDSFLPRPFIREAHDTSTTLAHQFGRKCSF